MSPFVSSRAPLCILVISISFSCDTCRWAQGRTSRRRSHDYVTCLSLYHQWEEVYLYIYLCSTLVPRISGCSVLAQGAFPHRQLLPPRPWGPQSSHGRHRPLAASFDAASVRGGRRAPMVGAGRLAPPHRGASGAQRTSEEIATRCADKATHGLCAYEVGVRVCVSVCMNVRSAKRLP